MLPIGIHKDVPSDVYNAHPAIRSSHLKILLDEMPADLKYALDNPNYDKQSPALLRGSVLHTMVLEPHLQDERYVFEKEEILGDKRSGEAKKAWDALKKASSESSRAIVPYDMYMDCKGMADSVLKTEDEGLQLAHKFGRKELTLIAEINGVWCKVRLDMLLLGKTKGGVVYDPKTTSKGLSDREIGNTIAEFKYHFSAAMYLEVGRALGLDLHGFSWVFMQSKAPYQHRVVPATPDMLERGRLEFLKTLEIYRMSVQSKVWKGYDHKASKVDFPDWYYKRKYAFGELIEEPEDQPETVG